VGKKTIAIFVLFTIFIIGYGLNFSLAQTVKLRTFDALVETPAASGYFTILDIDKKMLDEEGGWPFPRQKLAEIQYKLMVEGAIGVGWVVNFSYPDRFGGDEAFTNFISDLPTVVATFSTNNNLQPPTTGTVTLGYQGDLPGIEVQGYMPNIEVISNNAMEGLVSAPTEIDNLVRRMPLLYKTNGGYTPAFGTQVLKRLADAETYIVKQNEFGIEEITVEGVPSVKTDNLGRKWISWVDIPRTNMQDLDVAGKFVFIGTSVPGILPQIATPKGLLYPQDIQASLSESILNQNSPYIPDYAPAVELLMLILSMALIWLVINKLPLVYGLGSFIVVLVSTGLIGSYMIKNGLLIDWTWSFIACFVTGATGFYLNYSEQYKLRQQIKKQFEHYLDPRQVKRLQEDPSILKLGGEKRYATFLFTDVRGFTALSEKLEPEQVTYIMNKALTAQVAAVQKHGGMVDKFIGDALFAVFGAPLDLENHEEKAILCALDMRANMAKLNKELEEQGLDPVEIGCGINSGYAVIGNMGSETRFDYSCVGRAVNLAARLESGTKEAKAHILIGKATELAIEFNLTPLGTMMFKGIENPVEVYTWDTSSL